MDVQETLQRAEILFYQFQQRVSALDNKREKQQQQQQRSTSTSQPPVILPNLSPLLRDLLPQ